jgi:outer membrane protein OmpA-like peptidoglycan-associated protein
LQVYRRGYESNANVNYRIGSCYLEIPGQKDKAIEFLEKASLSASTKYKSSSLNEKYAPIDVYLYLGNAYRVNSRLSDAIKTYRKYKELLPADEKALHQYADKQIEACNIAAEFMSNPLDLTFENLGEKINSSSDDYNAVVSGNGSTLIYMHKLPFYEAVYFSRKVNGAWSAPENITPQIMSDGNQYVTDVSFDGNTLYLAVHDEFNSDIYTSEYVDNRWTQSKPLGSSINTKYWESHASISDDGNTLYFTSNRNGGKGNMDIYESRRTETGEFGPARNVSEINSELNEDTPFITGDGKKLYLSSQGFANMGGYDIFVSHLESNKTWSLPENMGFPVSTPDDDIFYFPWGRGEKGYYSRISEDGFGSMDIYKILFGPEVEESIAEVLPAEDTSFTDLVTDSGSEQAAETVAPVVAFLADSSQESTGNIDQEQAIALVATTRTIEISPVFFEFDKSLLSEKGKAELNTLIVFMLEFPDLRVELAGFADALGPETYNLSLSERRALAALKYVVSKGIDPQRLKAVGKGETEFIAPNTHPDGSDFPEGRKYNRRVELTIAGTDSNALIIKRIDPVPKEIQMEK